MEKMGLEGLEVGADPDSRVVAVTVRSVQGSRTCLLSPAEAETVAAWFRAAASHMKRRAGIVPNTKEQLHTDGGFLMVLGGVASVTVVVGEAQGPGGGVAMSPDRAEEVADQLDAAASDMKAQATGRTDLRNVRTIFPLHK